MVRISRVRRHRTAPAPKHTVRAPSSAGDGGTPQRKLPDPANPLLGRRDGTKRPLFVQDLTNLEFYDVELG